MNKILKKTILAFSSAIVLSSCTNDFLDREPLDRTIPQNFYKNEGDLAAYTIGMYGAFNTHSNWDAGTFIADNNTDNQAGSSPSVIWAPGQWLVGQGTENWLSYFQRIRNVNYFINIVEERLKRNEVAGSPVNINHYLGEAYFFRAYAYFSALQTVGDFPIVKEVLPDNKEVLFNSSLRRPRNEVARFIIEDLNKAVTLLKSGAVENKNRVSREAALVLKSRVGLFEGSWLKYHKNTAFVPGGAGWPGANKEYLKSFSINIDSEIDYFLSQSMEASKMVADMIPLVSNQGAVNGSGVYSNPYFKMFADTNMGGYSEVLLWRSYAPGLADHHTQGYLNKGGGSGFTKSLIDSYLMKNGLPIYAAGSGYKGDARISDVVTDRDMRLQLFLQVPGDTYSATGGEPLITLPNITDNLENKSTTGYMNKKGLLGDPTYYTSTTNSINGSIVFRATEAYLNYIEASYIKSNSIDGTANMYWRALRRRAGLPEDYNATIAATDLSKEGDWAKYSAGQLVSPTLYNIRRERRNELIAEGFRYSDLRRWRALDQVRNAQIEGFNLYTSMYKDYDAKGIKLRAEPDAQPNVSSKSNSIYLRPYQVVKANNPYYNGLNWSEAHYLSPIGFRNFLIASDGNAESSVIYQNPYWPIKAGGTPLK